MGTRLLLQSFLIALGFTGILAPKAHAVTPGFQLIDLGATGQVSAETGDINNSRQMVGTLFPAGSAFPEGGTNRAFRTDDRVLDRVADNLGLPPSVLLSGGNSIALHINNSGQVLAQAIPLGPGAQWQSYLIPSGGTFANATKLGTLSAGFNYGNGLNDLGQVVGRVAFSGTAPWHAYLYTANSPLKDLGTLGGLYSEAFSINKLGQITGSAEDAGRFPRAFRTAPNAAMTPQDDLGTLGGKYINGRVINDAGQVAGMASIADESSSHLFRTGPNAKINPATDDLGTLPGGKYIEPLDMNSVGDIVGWGYRDGTKQRAFFASGSTLYDLNDLIEPSLGVILEQASGINDNGDIIARGTIGVGGSSHAFLLIVPEPGGPVVFAALSILLSLRRRRM